MIALYGLKNCDACRKISRLLEQNEQAFAFVDIRKDADLDSLLPQWLAATSLKNLVNTRSTTWRGLDQEERERIMAGDLGSLAANPTLIKRPILVMDGSVYVGLRSLDALTF